MATVTRKEAITTFMVKVKQAYIEGLRRKNMDASGGSADSLKEKSEDNAGQLFGKRSMGALIEGRRPGKQPPLEAIIQWLKDKKTFRIDLEKGPSLRGLAFIIARKIGKTGTDIYQRKRHALNIDDLIVQAKADLGKAILQIEKEKVIEKLKTLKQNV
jgi:DNA-binding XRE family transcriptional regulator